MPISVDTMTIWGLVEEASLLVQLVMLTLLLASLMSWFIIVQRGTLLGSARRAQKRFEKRFWANADMAALFRQTEHAQPGLEQIFRSGYGEYAQLSQRHDADPVAVMEGVQRAMRVVIAHEEDRLERNLPFLATVGSVSPYIGLFGTVWGIMNSFIGLAQVEQATLAAVAPGIAEALIATAIGLFAAIPAVIAYNRFASGAESLLSRYHTFADELSTLLHRRMHAAIAG